MKKYFWFWAIILVVAMMMLSTASAAEKCPYDNEELCARWLEGERSLDDMTGTPSPTPAPTPRPQPTPSPTPAPRVEATPSPTPAPKTTMPQNVIRDGKNWQPAPGYEWRYPKTPGNFEVVPNNAASATPAPLFDSSSDANFPVLWRDTFGPHHHCTDDAAEWTIMLGSDIPQYDKKTHGSPKNYKRWVGFSPEESSAACLQEDQYRYAFKHRGKYLDDELKQKGWDISQMGKITVRAGEAGAGIEYIPPPKEPALPRNGISCWDRNKNGVDDPEEDINQDGICDTDDCQGPPGPSVAGGSSEWLELFVGPYGYAGGRLLTGQAGVLGRAVFHVDWLFSPYIEGSVGADFLRPGAGSIVRSHQFGLGLFFFEAESWSLYGGWLHTASGFQGDGKAVFTTNGGIIGLTCDLTTWLTLDVAGHYGKLKESYTGYGFNENRSQFRLQDEYGGRIILFLDLTEIFGS